LLNTCSFFPANYAYTKALATFPDTQMATFSLSNFLSFPSLPFHLDQLFYNYNSQIYVCLFQFTLHLKVRSFMINVRGNGKICDFFFQRFWLSYSFSPLFFLIFVSTDVVSVRNFESKSLAIF